MVIRFLLILLVNLVVTFNVQSQPETADPGKCYAKCLLQDEIEYEYEDYIVFTGDQATENVKLDYIELVIKEARTEWVKKKADRNCLSADPNDCLVWCRTETEEEYVELVILLDTFASKNFVIETIEFEYVVESSGGTEWREVVCASDVTDDLIWELKLSLSDQGYNIDLDDFSFSQNAKAQLTKFQKDKGLPIGNLDFETLKALGVRY